MIKENIVLLNKIKVIIGKVYNKGASDLLDSKMSINCEMDSAYEIMSLFEDELNKSIA